MRAYLYWMMRESLNPITGDNVELPPDEELAQDLASATFEITRTGILIESKDDIKKRLGRSPDKGDSCLLGWFASAPANRDIAKSNQKRPSSPPVIPYSGKVKGRRH